MCVCVCLCLCLCLCVCVRERERERNHSYYFEAHKGTMQTYARVLEKVSVDEFVVETQ